jgi:NAD+-dependent farnesol dehydrogenase
MRVLITGGTGYLGRALVRAFQAAGHATVAFSRHACASNLPGDAVDGDVRDIATVAAALRGCDAVCHAAALVSLWRRDRHEFDAVNVGGLQNVLAAARTARVARVVCTSSFLALPPAGAHVPGRWNDYQRTKVLADEAAARAEADGVPVIRMYPGVIYGPGAATGGNLVGGMVADHLHGRLPGVVGGGCLWSYAWVDDVAAAHVAAAERGTPGARYIVGGENAPQMRIFEVVRALTGRPLPRRIPAALASLAGLVEELRAAVTGRPPLLTPGTVEILTRDWAMDSSLAVRELGYRIPPLEGGLACVVRDVQAACAVSEGAAS